MKDIKKEFSGVWALSGITFEVYPGEIHCLVGENGAGKSTLMKVLSGAYTPTEGTITVDGKEYSKFDPFLSKQLGINIVYQENSSQVIILKKFYIMSRLIIAHLRKLE